MHKSQTRLFTAALFLIVLALSAAAQQGWTATRVGLAGVPQVEIMKTILKTAAIALAVCIAYDRVLKSRLPV